MSTKRDDPKTRLFMELFTKVTGAKFIDVTPDETEKGEWKNVENQR